MISRAILLGSQINTWLNVLMKNVCGKRFLRRNIHFVFLNYQYVYSKGTVLDKTVEYLKELLTQNEQLAGTAKLAEKSANALSLLQNQITVLEKENAFLRAQIIQFGIDAAASNSQPSNINRQILNSPLAQSLLNTVAQATQPPPPPPPQNPGPNTQATAQQLLISLAQSLTNSPLLTTPAQSQVSSPPRLALSVSTLASSPSRLVLSSQSIPGTMTPQQPPPMGSSPSQVAPLINSLVQTLASIASTPPSVPKVSPPVATQAPPFPQTSGGLSAAAAASLLNTLIMAQNVLTNTGGPIGQGAESASVLGLEAMSRGEQ